MSENNFDPRVVFSTTIIYIVAIGFANKYYQIILILPVIFYQMKLFSTDLNKLKRIFKYSMGLLFSMIFVNLLLMDKNLGYIFLSTFRLLTIIFLVTSMVSKMEIREIGFVIEKMLSPLKIFKIPVESIGVITALAFKFIPMLEEESKRIIIAQKARGIDYKLMNTKEKISNITTLFFPVVICGIQNAVNLAISMEVRGYGNGIKRTRLKSYKLKKNDYFYLLFSFIISALYIIFCLSV